MAIVIRYGATLAGHLSGENHNNILQAHRWLSNLEWLLGFGLQMPQSEVATSFLPQVEDAILKPKVSPQLSSFQLGRHRNIRFEHLRYWAAALSVLRGFLKRSLIGIGYPAHHVEMNRSDGPPRIELFHG